MCFFVFFNHRMQNPFSLFSPFLLFSSILLSNGARLRISAAVTLKVVSVLSLAAPETSSDARQSSHAALPAASRPQLPSRTHTCVCVCVCNIRLLRHLRTRRALQMGCESQFVSGGVIRLLEGSRWSEDLEAVLTEPRSVPPAAPFCFSGTG